MKFSSAKVLISLLVTSLSVAQCCSDRDFSISISNFVQCVENNFIELSTYGGDRILEDPGICRDLERRKETCLAHFKTCSNDRKLVNEAHKVLLEQWAQHYELEHRCKLVFSKIERYLVGSTFSLNHN